MPNCDPVRFAFMSNICSRFTYQLHAPRAQVADAVVRRCEADHERHLVLHDRPVGEPVARRIAAHADLDRRHAEIPASPFRHREVVADAARARCRCRTRRDPEVLLDDEKSCATSRRLRRRRAAALPRGNRSGRSSRVHASARPPTARRCGRLGRRSSARAASATPGGKIVVSSQRMGPPRSEGGLSAR